MKKKHMAMAVLVFGSMFAGVPAHASLYIYSEGLFVSTPYELGPTSPGKWGDPTHGTPATVSWSLMGGGENCESSTTCSSLSGFMPGGFKAEIQRAFDAWEGVASLTFIEVTDSGDHFDAAGAQGDIRIGGHSFDGSGGTLAHGYYPPQNGISAAGDVHFDIEENWSIGAGIDIFSVALHEIGHAIGLGHSNDPDAVMYPFYSSPYAGLDEDDINGAVALYGAPAPVPLPAAAWLMLSGLGVLLGVAGRRKRRDISAPSIAA